MTTSATNPGRLRKSAFTLLELIVVIMIIGVLVALIFPTVKGIRESATKKKIRAELQQVETAIEAYKAKHGHYPPDNPCNPTLNPLYFELVGTELKNGAFQTLDSSASVADNDADFGNAFGQSGGKPCIRGFVNCTKGAGDDAVPASSFLKGIKPAQYGQLSPTIRILACSVEWPKTSLYQPTSVPGLNPWHYVSSNPTNNLNSFDLWINVIIGGKTNRISNWSDQPQHVGDNW